MKWSCVYVTLVPCAQMVYMIHLYQLILSADKLHLANTVFSNVCLYVCFMFVYKCMYKNLIEVPSAPVWIYLEQGCVLFSKLTLKLDIPEYGIVSYVMAYDMVLPILVKPLPFDLAYCFVYVKRSLEVCSVWRGKVCYSAMYLLRKASLYTISKTNEKIILVF